jgi:hypothetical protein
MTKYLSIGALLLALAIGACKSDTKTGSDAATADNAPATTTAATTDSLGRPIMAANPWQDKPCELINDQEFMAAMGIEEKRDFMNRNTLPNKAYCLRTWKKPDWREREVLEQKNPNLAASPESSFIIDIINHGIKQVADAQFEMHSKDHINGYSQDVPGLGDGATFSPEQGMLMVKKGHLLVQLKLDHADKSADNLPKLKELAAIALKKM